MINNFYGLIAGLDALLQHNGLDMVCGDLLNSTKL